jgi:BioD-like phosphotransacetylase family protein
MDACLAYFRRLQNKAKHRSTPPDIQPRLETSTRCIILTGGFTSNDVVIGKAEAKGIPIISVVDDTFTAIDKIEVRMGKTSIREKRKVDRVKELMDIEFDLQRFLKSLK